MLKYGLLVLVALILIAVAVVRLRPLDPGRWHVVQLDSLVTSGADGRFCAAPEGDVPPPQFQLRTEEIAEKLHEIIMATPRTTHMAGSLLSDVGDQKSSATYVTRSALWGFPDVTTVEIEQTPDGGTQVSLCGRLVYGRSDFGVNEARIWDWLNQLEEFANSVSPADPVPQD